MDGFFLLLCISYINLQHMAIPTYSCFLPHSDSIHKIAIAIRPFGISYHTIAKKKKLAFVFILNVLAEMLPAVFLAFFAQRPEKFLKQCPAFFL